VGTSKSEPRRCGAPTQSGGRCRVRVKQAEHSGRCWRHGGEADPTTQPAAPAPATAAVLYAEAVLPSEARLFDALPVGRVDDELRLCRLRLGRAAAAEAKLLAAGQTDGLSRVQDEIHRITTRIDRLENRRAQLVKVAALRLQPEDKGNTALSEPQELARAIRAALREIEAVTAPSGKPLDRDADS